MGDSFMNSPTRNSNLEVTSQHFSSSPKEDASAEPLIAENICVPVVKDNLDSGQSSAPRLHCSFGKIAAVVLIMLALLFGVMCLYYLYGDNASRDYKVGSYVTFGRYPQKNGEIPEPIEWLVIGNDGNTALVVSKYGLDCKAFHKENMKITWHDCDLRKWLNGEFLSKAFNSDEQSRINESNTGKQNCSGNKDDAGTDKIFCLSIEEAKQFFLNDDARKCEPTLYAIGHNANKHVRSGCCWYWLRSPGHDECSAANVGSNGSIPCVGYHVSYNRGVVRPALRIKLNSK